MKLWRNRWVKFGWPVAVVAFVQVGIVRMLPTPPAQIGLFLLVDAGIGVAQWFSYRQALAFHRRIADLFEGRCTCDLYWDEFPCSIHNPSKTPGDGEGEGAGPR